MRHSVDYFPRWNPEAVPLPGHIRTTADRLRGMMLGIAVGDALGNLTEAMNPPDRKEQYGEITDYLPNCHAGGRCVGTPSDDTQLAFWTLESLLHHRRLDPDDLAKAFCLSPIYGIGDTMRAFIRSYKREHRPWYEAGQPSAGNGALMRIAPVLLPHLPEPSRQLWEDVIVATALTHNDEAAVASSVGFVGLLCECLAWSGKPSPTGEWWLNTFLRYSRSVETGEGYEPRSRQIEFRGSVSDFIEWFVRPAVQGRTPVIEACERWYSATYLLETVPAALVILASHGDDPEETIIRAVNDTRDNDTVAAIVGAAVGALKGERALPKRWRKNLLGRTRAEDDGHVFELLDQALQVFPIHPRSEAE
ncbi:MAG: ADP-ribosylglycohydrolase family protein [Chloroflexota bacterium]|nr:ADP-ribosylglycohydrolase family protein [Chloroflexota bacterium]